VAETLAALWLTCKGYRVLARRARTPYGEVDIAATKGGMLVVIEVKSRVSQDEALRSVRPHQRGRLLRAAQHLGKHYRMGAAPIRLDLMVVRPGGYLQHVRGAFRLDDGPV
jgi:putative endonuclease